MARGFDIAEEQIARAEATAAELSRLPGVDLTFEVGDLTQPLPEADGSIDLTVCLYSVLSHLRPGVLPRIAAELARVTRGHLVATVRPVGSPPSIFVDTIEKAYSFEQDNAHDRCKVELADGRRFTLDIHLFTVSELRALFAPHLDIEALRGLDLFHSRFKSDPRWNPPSLDDQERLCHELSRIEKACAGRPEFIEHAAHLLLVARGRSGPECSTERLPRA